MTPKKANAIMIANTNQKIQTSLCACVLLCLFSASGLWAQDINQDPNTHKTIIVATHDVDRISFEQADGYRDGWDIRVARHVLRQLGYADHDIQFIPVGVHEKFRPVVSGEARLYIGAATLTGEREIMGDFSIPHLSIPYGLVVRVDTPGLFRKILTALKRTIGWLFHPTFWILVFVLLCYLRFKALIVTCIEKTETKTPVPFWQLYKGIVWWVECTFCNFNADHRDFVPKGRFARCAATGLTLLLILVGVNYIHESMAHVMREYPSAAFSDIEIAGMHLGTKEKTTSIDFAHEMGASVETFADVKLALNALDDGHIDAVLYDSITLRAVLESHRKKKGYRLVYATEFGFQYYGAFFADGDPMLEQWNQIILNIPAPLIAEWNRRFFK